MKKRMCILLALAMMLGLNGCGSAEVEQEEEVVETVSPEVVPEPEPEPEPEVVIPEIANPLTGLEMEADALYNRPIAVMLNNHQVAMPQLGVSQADIIYEVPAEGGITRMLAVFQSVEDVGNLGSIRSSRHYYIELALGLDALYVHAGGSPQAYADLATYDVDNMDGVNGGSDAAIFWRDADRRATAGYEHSMLTSGEAILEYLDGGRYETVRDEVVDSGLTFTYEPDFLGESATDISVKFSSYKTGTFTYDEDAVGYAVGQYGGDYIDGNTDETVVVTNVLVLEANIWTIAGDTEGRLDMNLSGYSGTGWYFYGGEAMEITWDKADLYSPLTYTDADGVPLDLAAGHSYVCIVDNDSSTVSFA
ncbi:DUF3048 domain-containing protein [Bengtsoniella intestinalis]|uniref:DUF3048 domain-containing protein n=1 Tax=Bengtsoniella intestinalis TaxID=3073143 RepID=UPI00391F46B1